MQAFDQGQTKQFRRVFQQTHWLLQGISSHLQVELVDESEILLLAPVFSFLPYCLCSADLHIWSLSKDDRVATVKFLIRLPRSHFAPSVTDFLLIQRAGKHVSADVDLVEGSVGKQKKIWIAGDRL